MSNTELNPYASPRAGPSPETGLPDEVVFEGPPTLGERFTTQWVGRHGTLKWLLINVPSTVSLGYTLLFRHEFALNHAVWFVLMLGVTWAAVALFALAHTSLDNQHTMEKLVVNAAGARMFRDHSRNLLPWSRFVGFQFRSRILLLRLPGKEYVVLFRGHCSNDDDWARVGKWVREHLQPIRGSVWETLREFFGCDTDHEHVVGIHASQLLEQGKTERAIRKCERIIKKGRDPLARARCFRVRGLARLIDNRPHQALADFDEAARLDPYAFSLHFLKGSALLDCNQLEEALAELHEGLRLDELIVATRIKRTIACERLGNREAALEEAEAAVREDPRNLTALYNKAELLYNLARYKEALVAVDAALLVDPQHHSSRALRGAIQMLNGNNSGAIADLDAALQVDPKDVDALSNRAAAHLDAGQYERSVEDASASLSLDPDDAQTWMLRAQARCQLEQPAEALGDVERSLELDDSQPEAYLIRGQLLRLKSQWDAAARDLERAIELRPEDARGYSERGLLATLQEQYAEALPFFERAIELNPEDMLALNNLAWGMLHLRDSQSPHRALTFARRACELDEWSHGAMLSTYAGACAACGQFEEAATWMQRALDAADYPQHRRQQGQERLAAYQRGRDFPLT